MPSLENITDAIAGDGLRHIVVEAARCVSVRHRMARCGACMETCPENAIQVENNRITIDPTRCIGCGSCASECPTQALRTTDPTREELLALVDAMADRVLGADAAQDAPSPADGPYLEFACEHAQPSSAAARVVVPGLPYVDESVLLHAAARGFHAIALTCCNNPNCMQPTLAAMPDVLLTARSLLETAGAQCTVKLRRQKPPADDGNHGACRARGIGRAAGANQPTVTVASTAHAGRDLTRRGMLSDLTAQAATIVAETAAAEMRDRIGVAQPQQSLAETLTDGRGNLRKFPMPRATDLLDDLFALNPEPSGTVRARGFARVRVNAAACRRCAMCVRFCPTGALEGEEAPIGAGNAYGIWKSPSAPAPSSDVAQGSLSFRPSDCVGCHLCETACPLRCLTVEDEVDAAEVFELEPVDLLA